MRARILFFFLAAALLFAAIPAPSSAQLFVGFTVGVPPPELPVYNTIPPAPAPNYMWTPGYWAWGSYGYYWVPGTWVMAPQTGYYWTPGYWGYNNGYYGWNAGYWAPQVGYYGGINYGFGYYGNGFAGGMWQPSGFAYNTAVWPVNTSTVTNVYVNRTVINKTVIVRRTAYNGGPGGIVAHPDARQLQVAHLHHIAMTPDQRAHVNAAAQDRRLLASVNHGHVDPTLATAPKPFHGKPAGAEPPTAADKQAAEAQVHHAAAPAMEHKPAPATVHHEAAPPAHHPANAMTTEHKPPSSEMAPHHPANTMGAEHKPPAEKPPAEHKPPAEKPPAEHPEAHPHPSAAPIR
ncbi:MAG: YXWGXW repeat-containing protein [Candidatus Eremiobacteraeota bacterium]|nr:YXWGXW repeat-containing protein [Candidatus Eremiobacteraeota bacterium]MBV8375235.1 YXWGXW repeat-containing protein [Candidatus Eremiobacteraeota bacterium]